MGLSQSLDAIRGAENPKLERRRDNSDKLDYVVEGYNVHRRWTKPNARTAMTNTRPSDRHCKEALDLLLQVMYLRDPGLDALRSLYIQDAILKLEMADREVREEGPRTMEYFDPTNDAK